MRIILFPYRWHQNSSHVWWLCLDAHAPALLLPAKEWIRLLCNRHKKRMTCKGTVLHVSSLLFEFFWLRDMKRIFASDIERTLDSSLRPMYYKSFGYLKSTRLYQVRHETCEVLHGIHSFFQLNSYLYIFQTM